VHESVELVKRAKKRSAVPFANAVLRKFSGVLREQDRVPAIGKSQTSEELGESSAHPLWLVERWVREFSFDTAKQICAYDQRIPQAVIRIADADIVDELRHENIQLTPGRLLTSAYRVIAGDITHTHVFRENRLTIQDEASQLVSLLVGPGSSILDCCAAPGGKTRTLAERNPHARIVAMELHPHRARMLRNLVAANHVHVIAADARNPPTTAFFDRVLADVPCSGTGTLARNPEIKWRLSLDDLADLQSRQLGILLSVMQRVSPGGRLVYSTCSVEDEENSQVVEKAMSLDHSFHIVDCRAELERLRTEGELRWENLDSLTDGPYLRTIPGTHPGDGFFAAILEKR
jgi:16S rRNA (cytosine967-C5)-methyltransferase